MKIRYVELKNFRNYKKLIIDDLSRVNVFIGKNGIGKTSIIEAIYLGSVTKSFRSNYDKNVINSESISSKIKIKIEDESRKRKTLEISLDENGKKTKINTKTISKLSEYLSQYRVILFSPDELKIIKESPNVRRNYLNIEISQINKEYIKYLNDYNTLIKNKNEFLKKLYLNSNLDTRYLDTLDEKISELGFKICKIREEYFNQINEFIGLNFMIFKPNDNLKIEYISDFICKTEEEILNVLKKQRKRDILNGLSTIGIHRDDFLFKYNNQDAKNYASQGIQKLIVLSLKLSELDIFIEKYGIYPILLLDDIFSELDKVNRKKIVTNLKDNIQIFITTTEFGSYIKKEIENINVINIEKMVK